MAESPIRIAMMGGAEWPHAKTFSTIFNSAEHQAKCAQNGCPPMPAQARVVSIWDENAAAARAAAEQCGIERVADSPEQALEGVTAAVIADDCSLNHQRWVPAVLAAGVPFFLDKPMARTEAEAKEIVGLARSRQVKFFSASALRYARELEAVLGPIQEEGGVQTAVACGPNGKFLFYGIHPLELLLTAMGTGVESVKNFGKEPRHLARLTWRDGRTAALIVDENARGFTAILHTSKAAHLVKVSDADYFYWNLMRHFVQMLDTDEVPVPLEETVEIIRICEQGEAVGR